MVKAAPLRSAAGPAPALGSALGGPPSARRATLRREKQIKMGLQALPQVRRGLSSSLPSVQLAATASRAALPGRPFGQTLDTAATHLGFWRLRGRRGRIGSEMSRRRDDSFNSIVNVRCCRCRRVIGRHAFGWFKPKYQALADVSMRRVETIYRFPGSEKSLLPVGHPLSSSEIVQLTEWVLRNVPCKCRRRDGSRMSYTLALDRLTLAANYDHRRSDLIAGEPNFGLRPERRIPGDLLRRLGYPVRPDDDEWLPSPDGNRTWTSTAGDVLRWPAQPTDEPADLAEMPAANGPPSAGSVARSPD
jgi:hypothetical protein